MDCAQSRKAARFETGRGSKNRPDPEIAKIRKSPVTKNRLRRFPFSLRSATVFY
jgi:hypothetical protein